MRAEVPIERFFETLAWAGTAVALLMAVVWIAGALRADASYVDRVWGLAYVVFAGTAFSVLGFDDVHRALLVAATTAWGLRLSGYLTWRNWGHGEDPRYVAMRKTHGPRFVWVSIFTVFGFQGVLVLVVGSPLLVGQLASGTPLGLWHLAGGALFALGLFFETVGDLQLARFRANRDHGSVLDTGLWRYTRHPNYFGDACVWWGLWLMASAAPLARWTVFAPLLMTFLLLRVSGVALLERTISERRPDYARYVARTNAFFPWFPRGSYERS
jgi:steroid 5-alpha reductase family enzyme